MVCSLAPLQLSVWIWALSCFPHPEFMGCSYCTVTYSYNLRNVNFIVKFKKEYYFFLVLRSYFIIQAFVQLLDVCLRVRDRCLKLKHFFGFYHFFHLSMYTFLMFYQFQFHIVPTLVLCLGLCAGQSFQITLV